MAPPVQTHPPQRQAPPAGADLVLRHGGNVPRYTSYPSAPHFDGSVDAAIYARWLAALPADQVLSLYVHVPFCERLCWYCGCQTQAVNGHGPVARFLDTIVAEIGMVAGAIGRRMRVDAVHLGGGTPNILTPDDLGRLFEALHACFQIRPDADIAAELDPRHLDRFWVEAAVGHGLSRASLGIQDCDPRVQQAINRVQPFAQSRAAARWLREAGIGSLNVDLMYGLPHQTAGSVVETIEQVLDLSPDRIALFGYAHVPWMKPHQRLIPDDALPGPTERYDQQAAAADRLAQAGYVRIGLDHFAAPHDQMEQAARQGALRRTFQGYTTDGAEALIGLGPSAIGRLPQGYVQAPAATRDWTAAIAAGALPVARGRMLTAEDRLRGDIIEALMCDLGVDLVEICGRHDAHPGLLQADLLRLCPLETDGLVTRRDGRITVTERGRPFVRTVCAAFDAYLAHGGEGPPRHSAGV